MKRAGPSLAAIEEIAKRAERLRFSFRMNLARGYVEVKVDIRSSGSTWNVDVSAARHEPSGTTWIPLRALSASGQLLELTEHLDDCKIVPDSLEVTSSKSPVKGVALREAVVAALEETFPTNTEMEEPESRARLLVRQLRGGSATRDGWNALTDSDRAAYGPYRALDLRNHNLEQFDLSFLDFQRSIFAGASLRGSRLSGSNLNHCSLEHSDLSGSFCSGARFHAANLGNTNLTDADLKQSKLRGANLTHANLTRADLRGADLSGADLTGAVLEGIVVGPHAMAKAGTRYDRRTRFPMGFTPGPGWILALKKSAKE
jgi:uncharacterized protein YjbI with pentapeptide repeats